jgi:hypothetical protein
MEAKKWHPVIKSTIFIKRKIKMDLREQNLDVAVYMPFWNLRETRILSISHGIATIIT